MLRDLHLDKLTMELKDCQYITESQCFRNMTSLSLEGCKINSDGVKSITSNKSKLKDLSLAENGIGNEGCHFIANSPNMIHLETLNLRFNGITTDGCESLANSSFLPRLSFLNMEGTYTRKGIEMLKSNNHFDECFVIMVDDRYENNSENEYGHHTDSGSDEKSGSERELTESDED